MRRAIVALGVSAVLVGGAGVAAYAAGTAASGSMHDQMTTMHMGSMDMGSMGMSGADMNAMHAQMRDAMPAEMAEACDAAHADRHGQTGQPDGAPADGTSPPGHAAHHTNN